MHLHCDNSKLHEHTEFSVSLVKVYFLFNETVLFISEKNYTYLCKSFSLRVRCCLNLRDETLIKVSVLQNHFS